MSNARELLTSGLFDDYYAHEVDRLLPAVVQDAHHLFVLLEDGTVRCSYPKYLRSSLDYGRLRFEPVGKPIFASCDPNDTRCAVSPC